jgi:predicted ATP-dependent endonuclease of OLD family
MRHIIIRNIGAIKNMDINLNKVNVIMGPQSSGKSTIAKVVSFCQWVEKRYMLDAKFEYKFSDIFMNFHRIDKSYFSEKSLIEYKGEFVHIKYKGTENEININPIKGNIDFINHKNIYIPAERNFVSVIPNLGRYKETNDNVMNFLYDWFEAKQEYTAENYFPILNLNVSYHNIEDDIDKIILNENKKELSLSNASSGLQSLTPLLVLVDYLSKTIFKDQILSVKENELYKKTAAPFDELRESIKVLLESDDDNRRKEAERLYQEVNEAEEKTIKLVNRLIRYHFTQFVIEEPEQNLFPTTQRDLLYFLINIVANQDKDHKLFITTHSPFILYALNNCMMGYNIKDEMPIEEQSNLKSNGAWIDPKLVSIWEIEPDSGTLKDIKNEKTGTVDKHYFNRIMNEIMDEYYEMLDYLKL